MAEKVEVSQEDIAFVRSLEDCPDKPLHESMFVPFFASKIGEYREAALAAGRQQGLREAAAKCLEMSGWIGAAHGSSIDSALREASTAITALMEGEGE